TPTASGTPTPTDVPQDTPTPTATATSGTPEVCGDGVVTGGEQCDDGNGVAGDGCENDCTISTACSWQPPAQGAERFVGACGAPSFATIQDAIAASDDGDIVSICPGTWVESVLVDREVTIRSTDGAAAATLQAAAP